MANRVILHIGPRKTGTTYIQNTLWENQQCLAEQGFYLPLDDVKQQFEAASRGRRLGWWSSGSHDQLWARLLDEVDAREGVAVVSTELLAVAPAGELEEILRGFGSTPVEVVFGVRALSRSIPAEWQQRVRSRSTISYQEWLSTLRDERDHAFWKIQDPARIATRWSKVVPAERISAVVVPTSSDRPEELWTRFSAACGLDPAGFTLPEAGVNESLGIVQAELLRRVNGTVDPELSKPDYSRQVRNNLTAPVLLGAPGARRLVVPEEHHSWVQERIKEQRAALVAAGITVYGDPADLEAAAVPADPPRMTVTDAELVEEAVRTIVGLLDKAAERDRLVRRLRRGRSGGSKAAGRS
jgi:hypothetical protein